MICSGRQHFYCPVYIILTNIWMIFQNFHDSFPNIKPMGYNVS